MKRVERLGRFANEHVCNWMLKAEGGGKKIYECYCGKTKTEFTKAAAAKQAQKKSDPQLELL